MRECQAADGGAEPIWQAAVSTARRRKEWYVE
jgi:hypothetical protein